MSCGNCEKCSCANVRKVVDRGLTTEVPLLAKRNVETERQAIRQFLSRPAPSNWACGCMGPQPLRGEEGKSWHEAKRAPLCPCAMSYVEEVGGHYYQISENRSPDGITHIASYLGPVGGPYLVDQYGQPR